MAFKDWESFQDDQIVLPIGGKEYRLPDVSAKVGHLLRLAQAGKKVPALANNTPEQEADLFLGKDLHQRMVDDGVSDKAIARACVVVITYWKAVTTPGSTEESAKAVAEAVWEAGINPEALAAKLAANAQDSSSTGEVEEIPTPASTSGTKSRKATPRSRKAPAKAAASLGPTSPSSGD